MKNRLYICPHCSNLTQMIYDTDIPLYCCGDPMEEVLPGTVEASTEKHVPLVEIRDNVVEVTIGSLNHPMEENHWIEWVQLVTNRGRYRKFLKPGETPKVGFYLLEEKPLEVYAYCNLHGLWQTELK